MKKLLFVIFCIFWQMAIGFSHQLESVPLPYYVKYNDEVINVQKVYDKESLDVVFNMKTVYILDDVEFDIYKEINLNNYGHFFGKMFEFLNTVYYGYTLNPSDYNYFITQVVVWQLVCNYEIEITDKEGNPIDTYKTDWSKLFSAAIRHNDSSEFMEKKFNSEIWDSSEFSYGQNTVLDTPLIEGLTFTTDENILKVDNEKVGNYKVDLYKDYEQDTYSYKNGYNFYWKSLKGPGDINKYFYYNVYGTKLDINETLVGVNNKFGDATSFSKYELYLDDELKLVIDNLGSFDVKSNSSYTLKSISDDVGFNVLKDTSFEVLEEDKTLNIEKYVVSKNISLDILDDNSYYIYLKSNDELYEIIDKDSDLITLPYGSYYIVDQDKLYYQELEVKDSIDELLTINNQKDEVIGDNGDIDEDKTIIDKDPITLPDNSGASEELVVDKEIKEDLVSDEGVKDILEDVKEEISETIKEDVNKVVNEEVILKEEVAEIIPPNPLTIDKINIYLLIIFVSVIFTYKLKKVLVSIYSHDKG